MTSEPLPPDIPWYCMFCGASLIYTEISTVAGQGSASWRCSGCGKEDTDNWSEFDFTPIDQNEPEPDIEFTPPSPDYPFILPPPPPPPPLPGGLAIPPPPSYFDNPENARILWVIRRFNAPLSLAHASAQIEGTRCDIGAIGHAAEEIENMLGQLTRLTPESPTLDQINLGLKAWDEYFKRGFQS